MLLPEALRQVAGVPRRLDELTRLLVPLARDGRDAVLLAPTDADPLLSAVLAWGARSHRDASSPPWRFWTPGRGEGWGDVPEPSPGRCERLSGEFPPAGSGALVLVPAEERWCSPARVGEDLEKALAATGDAPLHVVAPPVCSIDGLVARLVAAERAPIWRDLVPWGAVRVRSVLPVRNTPFPGLDDLIRGVGSECDRPEREGDSVVVLSSLSEALPGAPAVLPVTRWLERPSVVDEVLLLGGVGTPSTLARVALRSGTSSERGPFVTQVVAEPVALLHAVACGAAVGAGRLEAFPAEHWRALGGVIESGAAEEDEDRAAFRLIADWGLNRGNAIAVARWVRAHRSRVPGSGGSMDVALLVPVRGDVAVGWWLESWCGLPTLRAVAEQCPGSVVTGLGVWWPGGCGEHLAQAYIGCVPGAGVQRCEELDAPPPFAWTAVAPGADRLAVRRRAAWWAAQPG
ncbi:MAG: hypothetical protein EA398_00710 [Deltaproteobacteria bacterium]|nr:MAG: hypothetical protein EA398_00710 [Deltaproteobacteria bacterium]